MSEHRVLCPVEPPTLAPWGSEGHEHACIHDALPLDADVTGFVEHKCSCGMTWVDRRVAEIGQETRP